MQGDLQCQILLDISNKNDNNADEKKKLSRICWAMQ